MPKDTTEQLRVDLLNAYYQAFNNDVSREKAFYNTLDALLTAFEDSPQSDSDPMVLFEWIEWEAPYNRQLRRLVYHNGSLKLVEKRQQKRDGEWKAYPSITEDVWADVATDKLGENHNHGD